MTRRWLAVALGGLTTAVAASLVLVTVSAAQAAAPSRLLFGTNLVLNPGSVNSDKFLNDPEFRQGLLDVGVKTLRMPVRGPSSVQPGIANLAELTKAVQLTKAMGLVPLVILRNPKDPELLNDDLAVIDLVRSTFTDPAAEIYYEWGNEPDSFFDPVNQVDPNVYVQKWNQVVPALKQRDPRALFGGPVTFEFNPSYTRTFLQNANPKPDFVTWHTYTCPSSASTQVCLTNIDDWTNDITSARAIMQETIGTTVPVWSTEWNWNPNLTGDGKLNNQQFIREWTLKAIQELRDADVFGAYHFDVEGLTPLASTNGAATTQGQAFRDKFVEFFGGGPLPSTPTTSTRPATTTPQSTQTATPNGSVTILNPTLTVTQITQRPGPVPSPAGSATTSAGAAPRFSFEDETLAGWSSTGSVRSLVTSNAAGGQDGAKALQITFVSASNGDYPHVSVGTPDGPASGETVTASVLVPANTTSTVAAKLYIQDSKFVWHMAPMTDIGQRGQWIQLSFTPTGYSGSAIRVGLQMHENPSNTDTALFLDAVTWP